MDGKIEMVDEAAPGPKVKVGRRLGDCGFCGDADLQVIKAFDDRIYRGWACPTCILTGVTNAQFKPDSREMSPIVFVARALRGDEPFKTLLKRADWQKANPKEAAQQKAAAVVKQGAASQTKRLKRIGLGANYRPVVNRRDRRQLARDAKREKS